MLKDSPEVVQGIEVAGQQGGYFQELQRDPRLAGRSIVPVNPSKVGNKSVRAQVWASRIQDDLVYLVTDTGWDVDAFLSEAVAFPKGDHDDQVDGVSGAVQMLAYGRRGGEARSYQG
jgi:predicted phage terminase large subunit-like protein